jgi:UDP-GlcNAc3NAcA epimerase
MANDAKVMLVVGARPQFVKAAALLGRPLAGASWLLVHTGQHYDYEMSAAFFAELALAEPGYHLGVEPQAPVAQLAEMTARLAEVTAAEAPAAVVVVGDTTSTLAGALAASYAEVPLAHVEAGMRSYDWRMGEERNRVLTDRLAALRLCPHEAAATNLAREGITDGVAVTGDVMYEVAAAAYDALDAGKYLAPLGLEAGGYAYVTCHRRENVDDPARLAAISEALAALDVAVYFPVHPRTAGALEAAGLRETLERAAGVKLGEPAPYFTSLALVRHAAVVVTDSGGVQREAYLFGTPALTLRDRTEWPETVAAGANRLVDADAGAVREGVAAARAAGAGERRPRLELVGEPAPSARIAAAVSSLIDK